MLSAKDITRPSPFHFSSPLQDIFMDRSSPSAQGAFESGTGLRFFYLLTENLVPGKELPRHRSILLFCSRGGYCLKVGGNCALCRVLEIKEEPSILCFVEMFRSILGRGNQYRSLCVVFQPLDYLFHLVSPSCLLDVMEYTLLCYYIVVVHSLFRVGDHDYCFSREWRSPTRRVRKRRILAYLLARRNLSYFSRLRDICRRSRYTLVHRAGLISRATNSATSSSSSSAFCSLSFSDGYGVWDWKVKSRLEQFMNPLFISW